MSHDGGASGSGLLNTGSTLNMSHRLLAWVTTTVSSCTDATIVAAPLALVLLRGVLRGDWSRMKQHTTLVDAMRHQVHISMNQAHCFGRMSNTS